MAARDGDHFADGDFTTINTAREEEPIREAQGTACTLGTNSKLDVAKQLQEIALTLNETLVKQGSQFF